MPTSTPVLDGRPYGFLWQEPPGQTRTLVFDGWPVGYLIGKSMTLNIGNQTPVPCILSESAHTATVTATVPATSGSYAANLWDSGNSNILLRNQLTVNTNVRSTSTTLTIPVLVSASAVGTINVSIIGDTSTGGTGNPVAEFARTMSIVTIGN